MSILQSTEADSTMKGDMIPQLEWTKNCGKLREKFGEKKRTTIFALPQAMKRQSGLAFSSHRFTMTQEGGNNTHFPSFCFPRDMFFFYILSSFLSSIFCLLLLWVASLSLMHNEQEDTLLPEQKNTRRALNREEENEDRKNEGWKDAFSLDVLYFLYTTNA